ncbi:putative quorum-sensing-regulated virulence factor [Bythopirellula polymerisocia]|uniref:DNA polymerase III subunit epsilon n=1 Tax=Bythopirellula polymerisocia TaxID=2528003 RepID=A0A5C6CY53_9BACT|nr:DUF3820 family protein [Bythopirellula polymerisocia]TWU27569.1 DNA polymerase III subunit epsilon [Bythopirellula polymerisocia]
MNVTQLMLDLRDLGIELTVEDDELKFSPKSSITPELLERIREHTPLLLGILQAEDVSAAVLWHATLDRVEAEGKFPPDLLEGCRQASACWEYKGPTGYGKESQTELEPSIEGESFPRFPDESDVDNEFHWSQITDEDREYLCGPREYPPPCPSCGGRLHHHPLCEELRASWEPKMPFGKHKGKPLSQVPHDYLEWLLAKNKTVDTELRSAIQDTLMRNPNSTLFEDGNDLSPPCSHKQV